VIVGDEDPNRLHRRQLDTLVVAIFYQLPIGQLSAT
jgi:hypothetical protein